MGCEETVLDPVFTVGKESTFRINKLYTSADGQYTLEIKEISDSRCPEGVVCFWSGEVTVKGELTVNQNKSTFELHTVLSDQQKIPDGFTMKIVDAKPYPKFGTDSNAEDMLVTLLIQKN
jgi:hypothetical protein